MTVQQQLLEILADGSMHSGAALAERLGVSRTAVWKQLKQMGDLGVEFQAKAGQGYVLQAPIELLDAGRAWAEQNLDLRYAIPAPPVTEPQVVMNGNAALALGVVASGMEVCSMYPITPATSVSHELAEVIESYGGIVHQSEDEIAAAGVAIGASSGSGSAASASACASIAGSLAESSSSCCGPATRDSAK